jgi:hypothetical protein
LKLELLSKKWVRLRPLDQGLQILALRKNNAGAKIAQRNNLNFVSLWWKDICALGKARSFDGNWFTRLISRKVGNGRMIAFWEDKWIGSLPLWTFMQDFFRFQLKRI